MSSDLTRPSDLAQPWVFPYPNLLGQPILLALAARAQSQEPPPGPAVNRSLVSGLLGGLSLEGLLGPEEDSPSPSPDLTKDWLQLLASLDPGPLDPEAPELRALGLSPALWAPSPSSSPAPPRALGQCLSLAAPLFPVTQFVAAHFGLPDSGLGLLEPVP